MRYSFILLPPAVLFLTGCIAHHRPGSYRLESASGVVMPPKPPSSPAPGLYTVDVPHSRHTAIEDNTCEITSERFRLRFAGHRAIVEVNTRDMNESDRIPVDLLRDIHDFRVNLAKLQAAGCLTGQEEDRLLTTLSERLPLPSRYAYSLRHDDFNGRYFFDLAPGFRIRVVSPLWRAGAKTRDNHAVAGYETVYYKIVDAGTGPEVHLVAAKPERIVVNGAAPIAHDPPVRLKFPGTTRYIRLFFLLRLSETDHETLLLGSNDKLALEQATHNIERNPTSCSEQHGAVKCLSIPADVTVTVEMRVRVRNKIVYIPLGGRIEDAVRAAGEPKPETILSRLSVRKHYSKKMIPMLFDTKTPAILRYVMSGDEEVTW